MLEVSKRYMVILKSLCDVLMATDDVIVVMIMLSEGSILVGCPIHSQVPCLKSIYLAEAENKSHKQKLYI